MYASVAGKLQPLVTMADTIAGDAVAFIGFGPDASDGKTAAFYAVTSTTDGIYTAAI